MLFWDQGWEKPIISPYSPISMLGHHNKQQRDKLSKSRQKTPQNGRRQD
jgi:hypothetical protein